MKECSPILTKGVVFVVGDSAVGGVFIRNSEALIRLGDNSGLFLVSRSTRTIDTKRRYLPPPESARKLMQNANPHERRGRLEFRVN